MNRIQRLLRLIMLLHSGRACKAHELLRQLKVSRRTLFRDLSILRQAGVPVRYDAENNVHHIDRSFFLPPINLTIQEVLALMTLILKYGPRVGLPDTRTALTALFKIQNVLPAQLQSYCGDAVAALDVAGMQLTDVQATRDLFQTLWDAAQHRRMVRVTYESFKEGREIATDLDPYRLVFVHRGWYVVGKSHYHKQVRTFKLDRIHRIEPTGRSFSMPPRFDLKDYFGNAWRMIRGDRRYRIRIRFAPRMAGNVEEVIWHHTQQTRRTEDGHLIFEADVDGLDEIFWWVLGYGRYAVVEEPPELRRMILEEAEAISRSYRRAAPPAADPPADGTPGEL